eukprot:12152148-Heterocapsa_arctica.AAC.2
MALRIHRQRHHDHLGPEEGQLPRHLLHDLGRHHRRAISVRSKVAVMGGSALPEHRIRLCVPVGEVRAAHRGPGLSLHHRGAGGALASEAKDRHLPGFVRRTRRRSRGMPRYGECLH